MEELRDSQTYTYKNLPGFWGEKLRADTYGISWNEEYLYYAKGTME